MAARTRDGEDTSSVEEENHDEEEQPWQCLEQRKIDGISSRSTTPRVDNGEAPIAVVAGGQARVSGDDGPRTRVARALERWLASTL